MLDQLGRWFASKQATIVVCGMWLIVAIVIAILVGKNPDRHSTYYVYTNASKAWLDGGPMYDLSQQDGYQYPPQFAILHTPFALMGRPLGDILWRWLGIAGLIWGIYRVEKQVRPKGSPNLFPLASILVFPTALDSIQNGQVNIHISALMIHSAVFLMQSRWRAAMLLLTLAVAIKPIAIVMVLLVAACFYQEMLLGLSIGLALVVALPYLTSSPSYATAQYIDSFTKMLMCAQPDRNTFTDVHGAVWRLTTVLKFPGPGGYQIDRKVYLAIQLSAALGTLGLCRIAMKRWTEPGRSFLIWGLAACYLMLFNPRNEDNSFVIVTPVIALFAAGLLLYFNRISLGLSLSALTMGMTCNGWGWFMWRLTEPWFKPALCAVFAGIFIRELMQGRQFWAGSPAHCAPQNANENDRREATATS